MEMFILGLFAVLLLASILLKFSILIALGAGLCLFIFYAAKKGFKGKAIGFMLLDGISKAKNILITFLLIGMMTALWRAAGTIPAIVTYSSGLLTPGLMLLLVFLLNCLVSYLTGTSFGTGATIGVISSSVALAMNMDPVLIGGAVLSGCYFGDRCSPVSTSMLLTAELTKTNPYENQKTMFKTGLIPLLLSCILFALMGFFFPAAAGTADLEAVFKSTFIIHPAVLLPAVVILVLSLLHMKVKNVMLISIALSLPICIFLQGRGITELLQMMLFGYHADSADLAKLLDGGGIISMLRVGGIVCISSAYAGIFEKTGLLNGIKALILKLKRSTNAFAATLVTAIVASMTACNQTLSIMLTHQLCADLEDDKARFASILEDTAVIIAPAIPWSIAGSTILYTCGLPIAGIAASVYLFLVPLWNLLLSFKRK